MAHHTKIFGQSDTAAVSSPLSGGEMSFVLENKNGVLDYDMFQFSLHTLTVSGLAGGRFSVDVFPLQASGYRGGPSNLAEGDMTSVGMEPTTPNRVEILEFDAPAATPAGHSILIPGSNQYTKFAVSVGALDNTVTFFVKGSIPGTTELNGSASSPQFIIRQGGSATTTEVNLVLLRRQTYLWDTYAPVPVTITAVTTDASNKAFSVGVSMSGGMGTGSALYERLRIRCEGLGLGADPKVTITSMDIISS